MKYPKAMYTQLLSNDFRTMVFNTLELIARSGQERIYDDIAYALEYERNDDSNHFQKFQAINNTKKKDVEKINLFINKLVSGVFLEEHIEYQKAIGLQYKPLYTDGEAAEFIHGFQKFTNALIESHKLDEAYLLMFYLVYCMYGMHGWDHIDYKEIVDPEFGARASAWKKAMTDKIFSNPQDLVELVISPKKKCLGN